ncbi:GTP pyrophosphokinase family protein [Gilvimarinus sp. DA14]|uniref:GTP pyrophosphokinase n=1 Tax=Gilvimarinus sp. DA14 TaxID=2956798 RepID=UPI0020B8C05F|nr:hypothetical protein [Gilvimarinus sp. DA14]UTF58768.1 hypothetical protein NHM04_09780 [Gilvimarinus sp. DA14]
MTTEALLQQFDEKQMIYAAFSSTMESLLKRLLTASNIDVHSISGRGKERSSIERKIQKKDKYSTISDITDIVGLRIICHYADEIDDIAKIIEEEFLIDSENSIDKRTVLDPDRFGYLSLHYVVSLKPHRASLLEYQGFTGLKFEIQVRSILQHTWAEIEHDIGYKAKIEVPKPIRRKFSTKVGVRSLTFDQSIRINSVIEMYKQPH